MCYVSLKAFLKSQLTCERCWLLCRCAQCYYMKPSHLFLWRFYHSPHLMGEETGPEM